MTIDEIIAILRASAGETRAEWEWRELLLALDRAGYAIVHKPVLHEVGKPAPRRS